ncbi:MAG: thiolase family protein [Steroidobacterales bacterium]
MTRERRSYDDVVLAAPVTVPYVRHGAHSAHALLARALRSLLQVAGLAKEAIDGLCVSSFTLAPDSAVALTQHLGFSPRWLDHVPMGGASGIVSLRRAARAVQSGDADVVACVAGDANQPDTFKSTIGAFSRFAREAVYPYGAGGPNASFALITDHYMREFGATREDFGKLCIDLRENARANPLALLRKPLTMREYLDARVIASPLHLFDCVMPCAGADGFLVMMRERAQSLKLPCVRILSTIERYNAFPDDPIQMRGGWAVDRDELYALAGVGPGDVSLVETYDDYPVIVFLQLEDLGFCGKGEAPAFIRAHRFTCDGSFPMNTSGGQLSMGQAGAAGGFLGLVEAIRQLTDAPLGRPVPRATIALVSGFGLINYDRGLCSGAALLGRSSPR